MGINVDSGIYAIKNIVNGKMYVGSSSNLKRRKTTHFSDLRNGRHYNKHLQKSFDKHKEANFEWIVLEETPIDNLQQFEMWWIKSTKAYVEGYNMTDKVPGGRGEDNPFWGKRHTEKVKLMMSEAKKKAYKGEGNPNYGKKRTLEERNIMVERNSHTRLNAKNVLKIATLLREGILNDNEIAQRYGVSRTVITRIANGKRWSNITGGPIISSERRGKRNIGKKYSEEHKKKISQSLSGRKLSEETKQKISQSKRRK